MTRPNILILHADQHRWDCLGAYGNIRIRTPHLDAVAAEGVVYRNCFCTYPVCTPSRYSLLCGQYTWEHSGWTNHCTLSRDIPTFPRLLRDGGYHTAAVGKMHFTPTYLDVGFDQMFLCEQDGDGRWDDDYHRYLRDRGLIDLNDIEDQRSEYREHAPPEYWQTFGALPSNLPEQHHSTTWIGDRAVEQLASWGTGGNLLMVGFVKPHHPFDPPPEWFDMYDPNDMVPPSGWTEATLERNESVHSGYFPHRDLTEAILRRVTAVYYATISQIDHQVGRIVDLLKERGLYDNTLIVYTSDHGDYMGHQHMLLKGNCMYDPLMRIPLIVRYPRRRREGTTCESLVNSLDVTRTIVAAGGAVVPASMRGTDLAAVDRGQPAIFAEDRRGEEVMVRTPSRKLLLSKDYEPALLFDLERDPDELVNVVSDPAYDADRQGLVKLARTWRGPGDVGPTYFNEGEPTIRQPNVPPADLSHRPAITEYYAARAAVERAGRRGRD